MENKISKIISNFNNLLAKKENKILSNFDKNLLDIYLKIFFTIKAIFYNNLENAKKISEFLYKVIKKTFQNFGHFI